MAGNVFYKYEKEKEYPNFEKHNKSIQLQRPKRS